MSVWVRSECVEGRLRQLGRGVCVRVRVCARSFVSNAHLLGMSWSLAYSHCHACNYQMCLAVVAMNVTWGSATVNSTVLYFLLGLSFVTVS